MRKSRYIDSKFPKNPYNITIETKNEKNIFSTYLFPLFLTLVSAYLVYLNTKTTKEFEERLEYKQQQHIAFTSSTKNIIGNLSELNSYIQFELEKEIIKNLTSLKLMQNIDSIAFVEFKQKYTLALKSIDKESIFLPKNLYTETKSSINKFEDLLTLNLLLVFDESFFDEFAIEFSKKEPKVTIGKKTRKKIHEIVKNFHQEYEMNFHHLQSIFRARID